MLAAVQPLEIRDTCAITHQHLAIDRRIAGERVSSRDDQRIAIRPVIAAAGEQAHAITAPADNQRVVAVTNRPAAARVAAATTALVAGAAAVAAAAARAVVAVANGSAQAWTASSAGIAAGETG